jgi:hypothetical protein
VVTTQEPGSCTLVAVGEREHLPRLIRELVSEHRARWAENPVSAMLQAPAFQGGATGTKFERYGAVAKYRVNLLPPDRKIGTWEPGLARQNAFRLATEWPEDDLGAPRFLLMGRRVIQAFAGAAWYDESFRHVTARGAPVSGSPKAPVGFGTIFFAWDRPCIALPHPSGRSRWWNGEGKEDMVRWWVDVFSRCFSS